MEIKIVKKKAYTFSDKVEGIARAIAESSQLEVKVDEFDAPSMIATEIALTVDNLDKVRELHSRISNGILKDECSVGSDILMLEPRPGQYIDIWKMERINLRGRLHNIHDEKMRIEEREAEKISMLNQRLFNLVMRWIQLKSISNEVGEGKWKQQEY